VHYFDLQAVAQERERYGSRIHALGAQEGKEASHAASKRVRELRV